ncbi:MAG: hypothetical protein PHV37_02260 [Candidatus Gastranaerophilales bacterium]|nr:hypothetical protein [Candidatus Gastranaerophilales bacterium]
MQTLLEKENSIYNKISKPDFSTRTGREFLAFFLQTKFKQICAYDKKADTPILMNVKSNFISKFTKRIINHPEKRILVGICGESASGKTTICQRIKHSTDKLNMPVEILSSDNYFNDISELIRIHGSFDKLLESGYDVDTPDNFQLDLLKEDLAELSQGTDIKMPSYIPDGTGRSLPKSVPAKSEKIVVVEGIVTMHDSIRDLFDIKVYVDIDRSTQEKWYVERAASRNQTKENALKQLSYVRRIAKEFIHPQKENADIIINGTSSLDYFEQIIEYIHTITNCFQNVD